LARLGEFTVHLLKAFDPIKHVKRSDMSFDAHQEKPYGYRLL